MKSVLGCAFGLLLCVSSSLVGEDRPPNIIFILADDLGYSELACYGNKFNETPNLDRMAIEGIRFTQAYAAAPVCSPYRAAFLTGLHPARTGILDYLRPNSANALSTDYGSLANVLRQHGYRTGMIGKWHLTGYAHHGAEYEIRPTDHGFDFNVGSEIKSVGNGANDWPYVFRDQKVRWIDLAHNRLGAKEYLTDRLNLEAVDFIERNRDQPFFLFLSHYAPHTILNGKRDLVDKYRKKHPPGKSTRQRCYLCEDAGYQGDPLNHWAGDHNPHLAAMLESIDDGVGQIVDKLKALNLDQNTIVIFTSDNGGETNVTSNRPLRGGKSQLYEGGIRVPLVVQWPAVIPRGKVCDQPTVNSDFYPTLLDAVGINDVPDYRLDGISVLKTWKNPQRPIPRDALYWHYPLDRPHFLGGESAGAVRLGNWKLIEFFDDHRVELFQLDHDPEEKRNVAKEFPHVVSRLQTRLNRWRQEVDARIPSAPLLTETRQLWFADHFSSGRASKRWFFNKDWTLDSGTLKRVDNRSGNTRIFLKKPEFKDVVIRFDFQFESAQEIRLMTGSSGHYNGVIHIHPDHFFIQTAKDDRGPWFSFRHSECAYRFEPGKWYTMTVEFIGDKLVAHVDPEHLCYAEHPILDQTRTYFAFQVDGRAARFDNVQIFTAARHGRYEANLVRVRKNVNRFPVSKSPEEENRIQKQNAHEWLYQRDDEYRRLVQSVDELDRQLKIRFPQAFQTHKEVRKRISEKRKKLLKSDPRFKELLFATHRAERAIAQWLLSQRPDVADLPDSRRKRELDRLREEYSEAKGYRKLIAAKQAAEAKLKQAYPELYVTDEEIKQDRDRARSAIRSLPEFQRLTRKRADAYRQQQAYLLQKKEN